MSTTSETLVVSTRANTNGGRLQVIYKSVTWRKVVKRTVCSSWSTAEVWLIEINHWEYYTNQPPTPMVSQESGGHHAPLVFALVKTTSVSLVVDTRVASHLTIHQYATLMSPN